MANQLVGAGVVQTITFETEQFDFANEYNNVQTFQPNQEGVYSIDSNVLFTPVSSGSPYFAELRLVVNNIIVATDTQQVVPASGTFSFHSFNVSTIDGLNAGDQVIVQFFTTIPGSINSYTGNRNTHFAAARFPFTSPVPPFAPPATASNSDFVLPTQIEI
ncbi:Uncharacterised protein [Mycobacteroides abscessus subsp. abscessus]|nr:Uncharacterised protein [Mycobacteroides abscessus subsp. abscessus]